MYFVYLNEDIPLYDRRDDELVLISPLVSLEENESGTFEFTITQKHPYYDSLHELTSLITVYDDEEEIFSGRIIEIERDFYNKRRVICEGDLSFFKDSIQNQVAYHNVSVRGYLETLVRLHNEQVAGHEVDKTFEVGVVTVVDNNDSIYKYTNFESTYGVIQTDLIDTFGGHLRIRKVNGKRYLDYLKDYPNTSNQVIKFGDNLLDFTEDLITSELATVLIPLGAELEDESIEGLRCYTTIEKVNDGKNYVLSESAVERYGWIAKTINFEDIHVPEHLKKKAEEYLKDTQFANITLSVSAIDLHMLNIDYDRIGLLDEVRIVSDGNGLDRYFPVTAMTVNLDKPSENTFTLGSQSKDKTFTQRTYNENYNINRRLEETTKRSKIVQEAVTNATELIKAGLNGYVVTGSNEQLIMDTDDKNTARKLWRWNLNGLAYSKTGYNGEYETAITMDGQILGKFLVGESVSADKLSVEYKTDVERKIELANKNAIDYTDEVLKEYYTWNEVETAIKNSADAVELSAKETAIGYTDERLKDYATSSNLKIETDKISTEVSKKMNSSDFSTKLEQSSNSIKIAWNNISKFLQFENARLNVYEEIDGKQVLNSSLRPDGHWFYRNGVSIGFIGTSSITNYPNYRGLLFDLDYYSNFMSWAKRPSPDKNFANIFSWYDGTESNIGKGHKGFHFYDTVYVYSYLRFKENSGVYSYADDGIRLFSSQYVTIGGKEGNWTAKISPSEFTIFNNVGINFYSNLDMHKCDIINQSDFRLKTDITETKVNGLDVINKISLKEFNWVDSSEHEAIGIIAQQLLSFAPELVKEDKGYLSIVSGKLVYYCIKAIQELSEKLLSINYEKPSYIDNYTLEEKIDFARSVNKIDDEVEEYSPEPPILERR